MRTEGMGGERSISFVPTSISSFTLIDQCLSSFAFRSSLVDRHLPEIGFQGMPIKDERRDSGLCDGWKILVHHSDRSMSLLFCFW